MNLRLSLYALAAEHQLDADGSERLQRLAGLQQPPSQLARWLPRGVAVLAAGLVGMGVIVWIAANWDTLGRTGRFALLQTLVGAMCVGAFARPALRVPLGLLAFLATGGLFAYFGQTYQTGADPWQLFALWAALTLPLCWSVRSDALWAPWALVVMTAISLWVHAHTGHRWRVQPEDLQAHLIGWAAALVTVGVLSQPVWQRLGSGVWAHRTALTLAVIMITSTALGGLFHKDVAPHYVLALGLFALSAALMALPKIFDVFGLCAVALGLNTLLIVGLGRWLFVNQQHSDFIGPLLLLGLVAAGLLAATVSGVLWLTRRQAAAGGTQ